MRYSQTMYAKQYAQAYINQYGSTLTLQDVEHMKAAIIFCRRHHNFMSLIGVLTTSSSMEHCTIIEEMFEHFSLPKTLKFLVKVLIEHKKLSIFASVLQDICCLYMITNNILEVTIKTAVELDDVQRQKFEDFFTKLSRKKIISTVEIDPSLIAGVRMQSDVLLWEYSIAARIRMLSINVS